ncbi:hypothetical protein F511_36587 [Dorcoceras hygrometricum]|uniref:Splicing factor 3B subunit 1-like n=1 Tax=Dorcoceras hygrometricum TaxID=472368 RepID=A0A2Z7C372_9LAMI|nr:hypothetical protein F511_36587 [Dorcoceras hygrometricum]
MTWHKEHQLRGNNQQWSQRTTILHKIQQIESCCISQLQVTCSGGTVDNHSKEATYVGDTSREVPVIWYTSRKIPVTEYQSQGTLALYRLPEMASSLISNSHHIDFESVFRLDDVGMVQMFETLITTGLKEFLGCPAVFYEDALTEFFANSSVREDGMVVSTIGGTAIEISQEMFAAAFELPTEGLIDLTDVPKNFFFDAHSLFSDSKEQTVSKKRPATGDDEVAPIIKKKRTTKGKPVAVKRLMVEEPDTAISTSGEPVAEDATGEREPVAEVAPGDADVDIEQVLAQMESVFKHQDADRSEKADTWFDEAFDEEFEIANEERQVSEEVIDVTIEEGTGERSMSRKSVAEELMTIDDLLLQISDDLMLPEHCDVLSMQIDSDLVIYRTTLVWTFQVVTICRVG